MGLTPMMSQYMNIKEKYQDCILFYRLGDFYEMFFEDAITVSREKKLLCVEFLFMLLLIIFLN